MFEWPTAKIYYCIFGSDFPHIAPGRVRPNSPGGVKASDAAGPGRLPEVYMVSGMDSFGPSPSPELACEDATKVRALREGILSLGLRAEMSLAPRAWRGV
jgi:hypothetical protein